MERKVEKKNGKTIIITVLTPEEFDEHRDCIEKSRFNPIPFPPTGPVESYNIYETSSSIRQSMENVFSAFDQALKDCSK